MIVAACGSLSSALRAPSKFPAKAQRRFKAVAAKAPSVHNTVQAHISSALLSLWCFTQARQKARNFEAVH
jgi:hypothetical protein